MYKAFKEGTKRILVATDLVGRGIDIERVNIVINYDMPETDDVSTWLHQQLSSMWQPGVQHCYWWPYSHLSVKSSNAALYSRVCCCLQCSMHLWCPCSS